MFHGYFSCACVQFTKVVLHVGAEIMVIRGMEKRTLRTTMKWIHYDQISLKLMSFLYFNLTLFYTVESTPVPKSNMWKVASINFLSNDKTHFGKIKDMLCLCEERTTFPLRKHIFIRTIFVKLGWKVRFWSFGASEIITVPIEGEKLHCTPATSYPKLGGVEF